MVRLLALVGADRGNLRACHTYIPGKRGTVLQEMSGRQAEFGTIQEHVDMFLAGVVASRLPIRGGHVSAGLVARQTILNALLYLDLSICWIFWHTCNPFFMVNF